MTIKKKAKTSDHSKSIAVNTKILDFYPDMFFLKEKPVSEAFIERLAREMVDWSKLEDSLRITQFFNQRGIPNGMIYKWMEKFPMLKQAHEFAMGAIADRRDIGAITRKYDGNYIDKSQAMYDPEYKKFLEWKASMAEKNRENSGTLIVQMMPTPSSDQVPVRKKIEDKE